MKPSTLAALSAAGLLAAPISGAMAAPPPAPANPSPAFLCANKNTGATRIPDNARNPRKKICAANEVAYRGALKVKDRNGQFLGFAEPGTNNPYTATVYSPELRQFLYLYRAYDPGSPDKQSLTLGDVYPPTSRTTYYKEADCAGQSYLSSGSGFYVYKDLATGNYYQNTGQLVSATILSLRTETYSTGAGWTGDCVNATTTSVFLPNSPTPVTLPFNTPFPLPLTYE